VTDLFDRLAARTLGAAGAAEATSSSRPRLPSRFEGPGPAGAALVVQDVAASAGGTSAPSPLTPPEPVPADRLRGESAPATAVAEPATSRPAVPTDPAVGPRPVPGDHAGSPTDEEAPARPARSGVVRAQPAAAAPLAPRAADGEAPGRAAAPFATPAEPGPAHHPDPSREHGAQTEPRAVPRVAAAPLRVPMAPASAASPAAGPAVPGERAVSDGATIRVSIGRVEVRANLVAAPPPRPAPRARREDALALGDYLRGKRGGA
jgi:hypothetical protein